jgi:hypothetical protein
VVLFVSDDFVFVFISHKLIERYSFCEWLYELAAGVDSSPQRASR